MVYIAGAEWSLPNTTRLEYTMKTTIAGRSMLAASIAMALSAGWIAAVPAAAPPAGDYAAMHQQHRMEHMQVKMKERIAKMASRLEIKASQQGPWGEYVKAREGLMANMPARPARDADAATVAKARAASAAEMARKLAVVSDATASLQAVLTADQRKVFDEMARRGGRHGFRGQRDGRGEHGGRGDRGAHGMHGAPGMEQRAPR